MNQAKLRRKPAVALPYFQALRQQATVNFSDVSDLISFAFLLEMSGDKTKSRAMFLKAREASEAAFSDQLDNAFPITLRAYALAGLGERDAALKGIDQALGLITNDARNHGTVEEIKARMLTRFGEKLAPSPCSNTYWKFPTMARAKRRSHRHSCVLIRTSIRSAAIPVLRNSVRNNSREFSQLLRRVEAAQRL